MFASSVPTHTIDSQRPSRRGTWLCAGLLFLAACGLYLPTLGFQFLNWDDPWYVVNNPLIKNWSVENLKGVGTEVVSRNYAPLTIFSYLIDHTFWGLNPAGYHLTNVLLHAVNGVLVFFLVRQVTGRRTAALVTAALFVVHPLQVETVAWISSRKGLLSATFILASLLCWLREDRSGKHEAWGTCFLFLALLAKALAVVVPAIILAWDLIVRRRSFVETLPRLIIPGFLAMWLLLATMGAQVTQVGGVRTHFALNKLELVAIDALILWKYVGQSFCPRDLCVLYDPPLTGIWHWTLIAIAGWAVVGTVIYRLRRSAPRLCFAAVCWILLLLPVLNLFPLTTLMNDRYLYLPLIPLLAATVCSVQQLASRVPQFGFREVARGVGVVAIPLAVLWACSSTMQYLPVWRDGHSLWTHAVKHAPRLAVVQIQWANTLHSMDRDAEAVAVLESALRTTSADEIDRERMQRKIAEWTRP